MTIGTRHALEHEAVYAKAPRRLLIGGRWTPAQSGETFDTINPSNGRRLASVALAATGDVDLAVAAARKALSGPWAKFKPFDRQHVMLRLADLIEKHFDELAVLDTLNMGAPISRTSQGSRRVVSQLRHFAGLATSLRGDTIPNSMPGDVFSFTLKEPVGVVAAINPWNGPSVMAVWKLCPVLASGCTVVLKPAEQSPLSTLRIAELCLEAGIPEGVVNVLTGDGEAGAALAAHPGVDKVAFTGSSSVGQKIVRASADNMKRLSMELGGKSANIVFADADMDLAVPGAAMAVFSNSGQVCSAGTRMFVERSIDDEFVQRVADYAKTLRIGDPMDPDMQLGPLVSDEQLQRVVGYLEAGRRDGARAIAGGYRLIDEGRGDGYFVAPTVFVGVDDRMSIAREEIFGPVISAMPFDTIEEVLERANDSVYGLGGGVWSRDIDKVQRISRGLRTGSVWANCYQLMDPAVPFGGYGMSGYGKESGEEQLAEYMNTKAVWIKTN